MCHNVGTLFQCYDVLWIVSYLETGVKCKMSITHSWPGPSPQSTNGDKRQPQVIMHDNILKKIFLYKRKETRSCKVSFNFWSEYKERMWMQVRGKKSSRTVFYICWEAEAKAPATSLWWLFHIPLSLGLTPSIEASHWNISWILQI